MTTTDLAAGIRSTLDGWTERNYPEMQAMRAALDVVLDRHKPGYPNGVEYEERDEAVYNEGGVFRGYVAVRTGESAPYWCEACQEMSPCGELKAVAKALGIDEEA